MNHVLEHFACTDIAATAAEQYSQAYPLRTEYSATETGCQDPHNGVIPARMKKISITACLLIAEIGRAHV